MCKIQIEYFGLLDQFSLKPRAYCRLHMYAHKLKVPLVSAKLALKFRHRPSRYYVPFYTQLFVGERFFLTLSGIQKT